MFSESKSSICQFLRAMCVVVCACCSSPSLGNPSQAVNAEGIGVTCEDALQQAKLVATEKVAGSYLRSERTLKNDKLYSEVLNEYSGGVIASFKILMSDGQKPCTVYIAAVVNVDKQKHNESTVTASVDLALVGELAKNRREGIGLLRKLVYRPDQFMVALSNISLNPSNDSVQVAFDVDRIAYTEEWVSAIKGLLSVQGAPVSYRKQGIATLGQDLAALFAPPLTTNNISQKRQDQDESICFKSNTMPNQLDCYAGPLASELVYMLGSLPYQPVLTDQSGRNIAVGMSKSISLLTYYRPIVPFVSVEDGVRRYRFVIVETSANPVREMIYLRNSSIALGVSASVRVGQLSGRSAEMVCKERIDGVDQHDRTDRTC